MINNTLAEIEARLRQADAIKPESRGELLTLLGTLKSEVAELSKTHAEDAHSITGFTHVSAHEATRAARNPQLIRLSLDGLASSVRGFEESHPKLVEAVNRICATLANLGI